MFIVLVQAELSKNKSGHYVSVSYQAIQQYILQWVYELLIEILWKFFLL